LSQPGTGKPHPKSGFFVSARARLEEGREQVRRAIDNQLDQGAKARYLEIELRITGTIRLIETEMELLFNVSPHPVPPPVPMPINPAPPAPKRGATP
jgi:hypothetical protein